MREGDVRSRIGQRRHWVATLRKRKAHLDDRVAKATATGRDLSYDKAESSALAWAISLAEIEMERLEQLASTEETYGRCLGGRR